MKFSKLFIVVLFILPLIGLQDVIAQSNRIHTLVANNDTFIVSVQERAMVYNQFIAMQNILIESGQLSSLVFYYNNEFITYKVVKYQGRYWLDRNLGAERAAESITDSLSYGDYYQWGRESDGHQLKDNIYTTKELASPKKQPGHSRFIVADEKNGDWSKDDAWVNRWYTGVATLEENTNVCPAGWHVPTKLEWQLASGGWRTFNDAFNSPLRISAPLVRLVNGNFSLQPKSLMRSVHYWSSTPDDVEKAKSYVCTLWNDQSATTAWSFKRVTGLPIRCIKDKSLIIAK